MTVRVIKREPDASVIKRIVCKQCGATLEYVPKDVKTRTYTCMGESSGHSYIECASCGEEVMIRGTAW